MSGEKKGSILVLLAEEYSERQVASILSASFKDGNSSEQAQAADIWDNKATGWQRAKNDSSLTRRTVNSFKSLSNSRMT